MSTRDEGPFERMFNAVCPYLYSGFKKLEGAGILLGGYGLTFAPFAFLWAYDGPEWLWALGFAYLLYLPAFLESLLVAADSPQFDASVEAYWYGLGSLVLPSLAYLHLILTDTTDHAGVAIAMFVTALVVLIFFPEKLRSRESSQESSQSA